MGNCCAPKEDIPTRKEKPVERPQKAGKQVKQIKISCQNPKFEITFEFNSKEPISNIIDQIMSRYPKIELETIALLKGNLEILDFSATLEEIGIFPGDILNLQIIEKSHDITPKEENVIKHLDESPKNNSLLNQSLEDIAEEESTTKHEIGRVQPKKAGMRLKQDCLKDTEASKL